MKPLLPLYLLFCAHAIALKTSVSPLFRRGLLSCEDTYGEGSQQCGPPGSGYCYKPFEGQGETLEECAKGSGFEIPSTSSSSSSSSPSSEPTRSPTPSPDIESTSRTNSTTGSAPGSDEGGTECAASSAPTGTGGVGPGNGTACPGAEPTFFQTSPADRRGEALRAGAGGLCLAAAVFALL
ncbi:uncharacterized protein DNG_01092 [Cephalotrichum gorgonifer]|uniref:Uncharacterized protein n=1 Tax=Cephalotrichum gorgonifer TaxID=2041049 RepID=A0AAE8MPX5_9PEZI|nr:uncharacterized protein DNG_01092 [Cephalotrichum gorgonifer]